MTVPTAAPRLLLIDNHDSCRKGAERRTALRHLLGEDTCQQRLPPRQRHQRLGQAQFEGAELLSQQRRLLGYERRQCTTVAEYQRHHDELA